MNVDSEILPVRALIVEDEAEIRHIYQEALTAAGIRTRSVDNGRSALATMMRDSFDVLVVDLRMQEMDGIIFLQEAIRVWPWIGVVVVSAYLDDKVVADLGTMGITRILSKPIESSTLQQSVAAEAADRRHLHLDIPRNTALTLMHDHLKLLNRIGHKTLGMESLLGALQEFGNELAAMMPSDVLGILVTSEEERDLMLMAQKPVPRQFIGLLEDEMFRRYEALSGHGIERSSLQIRLQGAECTSEDPCEIGSSLSVPVLAEDEILGILTLASLSKHAYTSADVSLLYHAANHISALFVALRRMHHLATRDHLTSVFNRIRLEDELERTWLMSRRYGLSMAVIIVDIDNFKTMNDSYGHTVGDEILRDFALLMKHVGRASDVVARYGGDEFVVILPRAEEAEALTYGERFVHSLRQHVFCNSTLRLNLTASVGIATSLNRTAPATSDELLRQADRALFMAKRSGRNRICIWPAKTYAAIEAQEQAKAGKPEAKDADARGRDHIVVVDDEPSIRELVRMMLVKDGHEVSAFGDAASAIEAIKSSPGRCDVLLTDLALPGKSGIDLLHDVTRLDDSIIKIVMTGYATVDAAVNCLREGAYDFIQKPVRHAQLSALVKRAMEYRWLKLENDRYQSHLEDMVRSRSEQVAQSLEEVKRSYQFTLEAMVAMLDARERQTGRHSMRTRNLAVYLAERMGLVGEALEEIASGAFLHDIGKIGIPDAILLKTGSLTPDEWTIMKTHSDIGYRILQASPQLQKAAQIVLSHHERYDGTGYPQALAGNAICIGARIFAVIDAYDAMRSRRTYREPVPHEDAMKEIVRCSGTHFDPAVVTAFVNCHGDLKRILDEEF
jgi:diguanylate cyclase (GGDEF)-like protein/putative nucleotidyltransferase with HDIG domain